MISSGEYNKATWHVSKEALWKLQCNKLIIIAFFHLTTQQCGPCLTYRVLIKRYAARVKDRNVAHSIGKSYLPATGGYRSSWQARAA